VALAQYLLALLVAKRNIKQQVSAELENDKMQARQGVR
jgi:hypothetical protein